MGKSLFIGSVAGIPIYIHWTLGLFFMFFIWIAHHQELSIIQISWLTGFILCLFFFIVLHELGHAFTAKYFSVSTKDIILSPLGGLARLEAIPTIALQEFWIALNGPLVNLCIAGIIGVVMLIIEVPFIPSMNPSLIIEEYRGFLQLLFWMNLVVFAFNLIPAFPMDGGRMLRSLLSLKLPRLKATFYATLIGRILAIIFFVAGLYFQQYILAFVGIFIFVTSGIEYNQLKLSEKLDEVLIADLQGLVLNKVDITDDFSKVIDESAKRKINDYLVYEGNEAIGSLPEQFINEVKKDPTSYSKVSDLFSKKLFVLEESSTLKEAFQIIQLKGVGVIGVTRDNHIIASLSRTELDLKFRKLNT